MIRHPDGGFQWNPQWRVRLPTIRGVHAPPLEPVGRAPVLRGIRYYAGGNVLRSCFDRTGWTYWVLQAADLPAEHLEQAAAAATDETAWLEVLAQAAGSEYSDFEERSNYRGIDTADKHRAEHGYASALDWATRQCLARQGLASTLRCALQLWRLSAFQYAHERQRRIGWHRALLAPLRQAIACAPDAEHAMAMQIADQARGEGRDLLLVCAHLFPHQAAWAQAWLALGEPDDGFWLAACSVLPPGDFLRYLERHPGLTGSTAAARRVAEAAFLLQLHLHGEAAFEALALWAKRAVPRDDSAEMTSLLALLTRMHVPALLPLLASHMGARKVRVALERLARQFPQATLRAAIDHTLSGRNRAAEGWTIRLALQVPDALPAALAELEPARRARFEDLLAMLNREPAPPESLPELLLHPPWERTDRAAALPAFDVPPLPTPERLVWAADREAWARKEMARTWRAPPEDCDAFGFPLALRLRADAARRLLDGGALQPGDVGPEVAGGVGIAAILQSPPQARAALWNTYPVPWLLKELLGHEGLLVLLLTLDAAAIPGCVRIVTAHDGKAPWLAHMLDTPALVPSMLHLLRNVRLHRETAIKWLKAYPGTALYATLPLAFAPTPGAGRDDARHGVRWLVDQGFTAQARAVAEAYGGLMPAALAALLATDPLDVLPDTMPVLPPFFQAKAFRRPELRAGGVLPATALEHIARMLAIGLPQAPYVGIRIVRDACTPASLAEFAWDVYEAWTAADSPASGRWAFGALAQLGDAETAARLATRVREWASQPGMRGRAADGLDILRAMGSDAALLRIHAIASKGSHKRTREHAWSIIHAIARDRGLGLAELEDRLAPTLGLEEPEAATFDFGPRHFTLGFDEGLRPVLHDAQGRRLKDLPKAGKGDDAARAQESTERWKLLRKEAKAMASLQITRLERAMVHRRRWNAGEFQRLFVEHPVMRYLASRLAWGWYAEDQLAQAFRVAEDATLGSLADELLALPEDAIVGIAHPLELDDGQRAALVRIHADYEIIQPFKQLARETHALTPEEAGQQKIGRFHGRSVATGALQGLEQKGWHRGSPQEGGMVATWWRAGPDGLGVGIGFSPGIFVAGRDHAPRQSLEDLWVTGSGALPPRSLPATFGQLDPIFLSEVLRDIDLLAPTKE